MVTSTWTVVLGISISEPKEETMTRGNLYKFALLNQAIIKSLWEIGHNVVLKRPNQVRPIAFKRGFRELPHGLISDIEDPKSQR